MTSNDINNDNVRSNKIHINTSNKNSTLMQCIDTCDVDVACCNELYEQQNCIDNLKKIDKRLAGKDPCKAEVEARRDHNTEESPTAEAKAAGGSLKAEISKPVKSAVTHRPVLNKLETSERMYRENAKELRLRHDYDDLKAFNKEFEELTKIAHRPVDGRLTRRSSATPQTVPKLARKPGYVPVMPTINEAEPSGAVDHVVTKAVESAVTDHSKPVPLPPEPRGDPRVIATWNVNGVGRAVKTGESVEHLRQANSYCQAKNVDVLFVQEAKLRCSEHGDQSKPHTLDDFQLGQFMAYFPEYNCEMTLMPGKKYHGQLMLWHKSLRKPAMAYGYTSEPDVHHSEGRVLIAEFDTLKAIGVYTPCISNLSPERLARRRKFDKQTKAFLTLLSTTSHKPYVLAGDMNAVEDVQSTTNDAEHWSRLVDNKHFNVPANTEDWSWPGTTVPEIKRLSDIKTAGNLKNMVRTLDSKTVSNRSWHAPPTSSQRGAGCTFDHVFVCEALVDANCVKDGYISGLTEYDGRECLNQSGFFGSDHAFVVQELEHCWKHRYEVYMTATRELRAIQLSSDALPVASPVDYAATTAEKTLRVLDSATIPDPLPVRKARTRQKCSLLGANEPPFEGVIGVLATLQMCHMALCMSEIPLPLKAGPMTMQEQYLATHKTGEIVLEGNSGSITAEALFDTGCQDANYVSSDFLDRHHAALAPFLTPCAYRVYFGDRTTFQDIRQQLTLPLRFTGEGGKIFQTTALFNVLDGKGRDLIIGTPLLFRELGVLFTEMITNAVRVGESSLPMHLNALSEASLLPDEYFSTVEEWHEAVGQQVSEPLDAHYLGVDPPQGSFFPWKYSIGEPSPDDDLVPEADSHAGITDFLRDFKTMDFLQTDMSEVEAKFEAWIDSNVTESLLKDTNMKALLREFKTCFIKSEWLGMNIPDLKLEFKDTAPDRLYAKARPIPPKLLKAAEAEFRRMLTYFYEPANDSPWVSPMVVAPKATSPFIRLCIDLTRVNSHLKFGHYPIPNVQHLIQELQGFSCFIDADIRNAFHGIRIAEESRNALSVVVPGFGVYRPKFMPEGLACGSLKFMEAMDTVFQGLNEPGKERWLFLLHDNVLIGGHNDEDLCRKMRIFLQRCKDMNVYLKFEKTNIGQVKQHFFGYDIEEGSYSLREDRSEAIDLIQFPEEGKPAQRVTAMKSFLGSTRIFQPHVPDYAYYSAHLDHMTSKKFDWTDESTWKQDYRAIFTDMKAAMKNSMSLYYPDYTLDWILRTDASNIGYGGVLYQVKILEDGTKQNQALKFMSKAWKGAQERWDTFTQETWGMFDCIRQCEYLLRMKPFVLECDHANCLHLERSTIPKIIRQHLYIRTFTIFIRHVVGKANTADFWSRINSVPEDEAHLACMNIELWDKAPVGTICGPEQYDYQYRRYYQQIVQEANLDQFSAAARGPEPALDKEMHCCAMHAETPATDPYECCVVDADVMATDFNQDFWNDSLVLNNILDSVKAQRKYDSTDVVTEKSYISQNDMLKAVHGGTMLHQGVRRTWLLLNKLFPGHRISMKKIQDFLDECPVCQKCRYKMRDNLEPYTRVLKPPHARHTIGCDTLSITPKSKDGYVGVVTIVNHFTHYVYLYPIKDHSPGQLANAMMSYVANFGLVDEVLSDQGSDLMSAAIADLNAWLGLRHKVSLVDVHTSNGCENSNRQIIQHLKSIVSDLRLKDQWADPLVLALVQYHFNSSACKETGYQPYSMMMGSADELYYHIEADMSKRDISADFVKRLDDNLKIIREASAAYQATVAKERIQKERLRNQYAIGDLVLKTVTTPTKPRKREKLGVDFTGPWEILAVHANDYTCKHITENNEQVFHTDMLKPYFGTREMAERVALLDSDTHFVLAVSAYCGDPWKPMTCEFRLHYEDGSDLWLKYKDDKNLRYCKAFQVYCASVPELWPLLHTQKDAKTRRSQLNKTPITGYTAGDLLYVDLRVFGTYWYNAHGAGSLKKPLPNEDTTTYVCQCIVHQVLDKSKGLLITFPELQVYQIWTHENVLSWGQYRSLHEGHVLVTREFLDENPQVEASFAKSKVREYLRLLDTSAKSPRDKGGGKVV